jgi:hypothetical protein
VTAGKLERRRVDEQADADGCGSAREHGRSVEGVELWARSGERDVVVCGTTGAGAVLSYSTASTTRCEYYYHYYHYHTTLVLFSVWSMSMVYSEQVTDEMVCLSVGA